jgi:hypothetical protein
MNIAATFIKYDLVSDPSAITGRIAVDFLIE